MGKLITESRIDGAFKGWMGRGVYKLINGQEWEQVNYKYRYKYKYRPVARVIEDGGRYWLEVDGMNERIQVRRK